MSGHQQPVRGKSNVWLTPPAIIEALGGPESFDLDPCAAPDPRPWSTARRHIALPENGLVAEWSGRVWLNPPYGDEVGAWLDRLAMHRIGTALVFARTETEDWQRRIWPRARGILFLEGRLHFHYPTGQRARFNGGAPSALAAFGEVDAQRLCGSGIKGHFVWLRPKRRPDDGGMGA